MCCDHLLNYSQCVFVLIIIDSILTICSRKNRFHQLVAYIANTKDQNTYIFFKDVLDEIERRSSLSSCNCPHVITLCAGAETDSDVTLQDALAFTGSDAIPPLGFSEIASIR